MNVTDNGLARISKDLRMRLRHHAFALGVSQVDLLNRIVGEWLEKQPHPANQSKAYSQN